MCCVGWGGLAKAGQASANASAVIATYLIAARAMLYWAGGLKHPQNSQKRPSQPPQQPAQPPSTPCHLPAPPQGRAQHPARWAHTARGPAGWPGLPQPPGRARSAAESASAVGRKQSAQPSASEGDDIALQATSDTIHLIAARAMLCWAGGLFHH
jgi:hypothetical protein